MNAVKSLKTVGLVLIGNLVFSLGAAQAQEAVPPSPENAVRKESVKNSPETVKTANETTPQITPKTTPTPAAKPEQIAAASKTDVQPPIKPKSDEAEKPIDGKNLSSEEAAVVAYYNNYLTDYRLGPNDVIAVEVFGQCPDYCKESLTVPPTARISYPLIRGGVFVGGRTIEDIEQEITKKLDEYIIEPKVTVTLVKAMSARYSVMGKVATPGIRIMDRKVSLSEAVAEAGGVLKEGNRKKVALVRFNAQGNLTRQDVDLAAIENGKAAMIYLAPGDQVFVPGKGFTIDTVFKALDKVSLVRLLLGSPF